MPMRICFGLPTTGLAVLHRLRPVGPARHGDVDLRLGDHRRRADQAVQSRQDAARLHLCRRCGRVGRAPGRSRAVGKPEMVERIARSRVRVSAPWRVYNIGNNKPVELLEVVRLLEEEIGKKAKRELLPMQPGDVPATYADVDDLMRDVGFQAGDADRRWHCAIYRLVSILSSPLIKSGAREMESCDGRQGRIDYRRYRAGWRLSRRIAAGERLRRARRQAALVLAQYPARRPPLCRSARRRTPGSSCTTAI